MCVSLRIPFLIPTSAAEAREVTVSSSDSGDGNEFKSPGCVIAMLIGLCLIGVWIWNFQVSISRDRLYDGPERPASETAVIEYGGTETGSLVEFADHQCILSHGKSVKVLPGLYKVRCSSSVQEANRIINFDKVFVIEAKAGYTHTIEYKGIVGSWGMRKCLGWVLIEKKH